MKIPRTDLHVEDPFYPCPLCTKGYFNLGNLSRHIERKHPEHAVLKK